MYSAPRLSIVVLPFANLSGDAKQDYFVDGMTESLTTDLSRISGSFVIGRHTAFTYKGKAVDLKQVGRELNVRYVLEGSVQRGGDRLRVNAQLVDAGTGAHLWADRFDKPLANLFDMQDEIVSRLANTLNAQLTEQEARRSEQSPHPNSMDLYFQGKALVYKGWSPEYLVQAREIFERALALDPKNVEAMVWTAAVDLIVGTHHFTDDRATLLVAAAKATVVKVLSLAPSHAFAHLILSGVFINSNRGAEAIAECERALALDHNSAEAHALIGTAKLVMGRAAKTEAHINEALRLSPRDIFAPRWFLAVGMAKLQLNADTEALCWLRRSIEASRNYPFTHFMLAATLALLGSLDEPLQRRVSRSFRALPSAAIATSHQAIVQPSSPCASASIEGMRMAGVPEG